MKKGTKKLIKEVYGDRSPNARKYDHGLVIVIGGSKLYTGSPALSAMAAMRAGADITHIAAPVRAADIAASFSPNLITFPLDGDYLSFRHLPDLLSLTKSGEEVSRGNIAVVLGGGIGRGEETKQTVREYIKETSSPAVIDADAIYAFEEDASSLRRRKDTVITPHLREFFVLTGNDIEDLKEEEKEEAVKEAAKDFSALLLKGSTDYISDGNNVARNEVAVPYLTTGGTGDVLSGITGALLARGKGAFLAAHAAAAINTAAGGIVAKEKGESLLASDLLDKIPSVINH